MINRIPTRGAEARRRMTRMVRCLLPFVLPALGPLLLASCSSPTSPSSWQERPLLDL